MNTRMQKFLVKRKASEVDTTGFNKTVHTLIELLGRDMESVNPSRDKDMLVVVREGLFRVEVAGQLFDHVKAFREMLLKHYPDVAVVEFDKNRHIDLTKATAKLSLQPFTGRAQIHEFLKEFGVDMENTKMAIFAITQFIEMVRRLPMKIFVDQDNRFQIISTMQCELDELIILEEMEERETAEEAEN
jgi:hypothetical protein